MTDAIDRDQEPDGGRSGELHPIGRALRSTYRADNHDTLGTDLTGLMLQLARVDDAAAPAPPPVHAPPPEPGSWLRRLMNWARV